MLRQAPGLLWLIVLGCSDSTPEGTLAPKPAPMTVETQFWQWFAHNSAELAKVETGKEQVCSELAKLLTNVEKGFILLDFSLGEEDMELRVGSIEFLALTDAEKSRGLKPFTELAALFDAFPK